MGRSKPVDLVFVQHNLLVVLPDVYQPGAIIQVVRFFGVSLMDILLLLIIVVLLLLIVVLLFGRLVRLVWLGLLVVQS